MDIPLPAAAALSVFGTAVVFVALPAVMTLVDFIKLGLAPGSGGNPDTVPSRGGANLLLLLGCKTEEEDEELAAD